MTDSTILPGQRAALVDRNGTTTPEFYRFFRSLSVTADLPARVDDLTVRVTALEDGDSAVGNVVGKQSIVSSGVLSNGLVLLRLDGDVDAAPALSFYGALTAGAKGWQAYSSNFSALDNGDGTSSLDLADVADSGAGAALVKIARDSKGRISGTSAATTTDLTEGSSLYFTAARVLATVLAALSTATNATITAADTVLSALGKLQAQITANLATLTSHTSNTSNPHSVTKAQVGLGSVDNTSDVNKPVSTAQAAAIALKQDISGLGTAAFVNTGNNAAGLVPVLDSPGTGQTSLTLRGASARANLYLQSGNADAVGVGEGTFTFAGTSSVSASTEKRLALLFVNTDGSTANNRGGKFGINLKQDGNTTLVPRLNVSYLGHTEPGADNAQTMGSASLRWSVVYAATGTINTSDAREKTDVAPLTAAELAAAADLARAPGTYQWLSAVQAKGADARLHAGLTVQQAIAIMQSHGLDPFRYGFICYDQWPETPEVVNSWPAQDAVLDDAGNVVTPAIEAGSEITQEYRPAGDRYSFRHDELLLFIARGFAARLDALESA